MNNEDKLRKVLELTEALEARKALYDELDKLTLELQSEGFVQALVDGNLITMQDNFSEKNVQWRMAAVRRYEIKIQNEKKRKGAL
jgi:hypothetical protein